jgi:Flp pilus assembly pilin Flp
MELVIRLREGLRAIAEGQAEKFKALAKGQTMTEYALILAAVAVVVFITYEVMGQDITSFINAVDTDLTTAS